MSTTINPPPDFERPLKSQSEFDEYMEEICCKEQVYSMALFDILGFSNFVESNGNQVVLDLYNKLLDLVDKQKSTMDGQESIAGSVVPAPVSNDWKQNVLIADANGYINVCHFSDTFLIYVNYQLSKRPFWLRDQKYEPYPLLLGEIGTEQYPIMYDRHHIYLSFLQTCMDFFCQAIVAGIPLRGCVSTGLAVMNPYKSIYLGSPLVEAARGETAQNAIGIAFGKSFNNSHPVYNDYFIPYLAHIKEKNKEFLSPMMLDWARYWRESSYFNKYNLKDCINKMNNNPHFSSYYDNAIKFFDFSANHKNWSNELDREAITDIKDYYVKANEWYKSVTN
ncbi:MAG: hypothetical protein IJ275_04310 [Ruminococcus sp.]|nr:hypothetical protein [Ruminococcus sp.]